jgi:hypothetical protein
MNNYPVSDLFQLQTELIDIKVDMATGKAIDRVVEQITALRHEMHTEMHKLRNEMHNGFSSLDKRVVAIETKLGMVNETQKEIRTKFIDYSFKAGWLILGIIISYALIGLHIS